MPIAQPSYLTPEEFDGELLGGILDETLPRHRRILDWVDVDADNDEEIEMEVLVQSADEAAPITGFGDRTPFTKGLEIETIKVEPYHIKIGYPFPLKSKHLEKRANRTIAISEEGVRLGMANLEERRVKRHLAAVMAMLNTKAFTYTGNGLVISVPYDSWIGDLDAPAQVGGVLENYVALNDEVDAKPASAIEIMRGQFESRTGQAPTLAWISPQTAATFKELPDVKKHLEKQSPSDPDDRSESYERFFYNGIWFEVLRHSYKDGGVLKQPLPEGLAVVTVQSVDDRGGSNPIIMNKARNKLNNMDATTPTYEVFQTSKNPVSGGLGGYDNALPSPARENIIQHWQMYPTP